MAQFLTVARTRGLLKKAQSAKELLDLVGVDSKSVKQKAKAAVHTGFAALAKATDYLDHEQRPRGSRGTDALRACGFVVTSEHGEHRGPTSHLFNIPGSRAEMMEMMVFLIKRAYSPGRVNVAVWDAEMDVDVAKFCGLEECGTAISGTGLAYTYRFAVFRGVGQVKWTGGVPRGGIPDVGCSGNVSMGADSIWFGNTDSSPHFIVTDLVKLMEN